MYEMMQMDLRYDIISPAYTKSSNKSTDRYHSIDFYFVHLVILVIYLNTTTIIISWRWHQLYYVHLPPAESRYSLQFLPPTSSCVYRREWP